MAQITIIPVGAQKAPEGNPHWEGGNRGGCT